MQNLSIALRSVAIILLINSVAAAQFFTRATDAGTVVNEPLLSSGASWNDVNNDDLPDLYVLAEDARRFYLNNGDGTFLEITDSPILDNTGVANVGIWGDYDNDGNLDMYLCNFATAPGGNVAAANVLYKNNGLPNFELTEIDIGTAVNASPSGSWIDYDQDGDLDLFTAGAGFNNGAATSDLFYRNNGGDDFQQLSFLPILKFREGIGTHDAWIAYDNDGDQDLFVLKWRFPNELYRSMLVETGNPNHFELVDNSGLTNEGTQFDLSANWGDYDNDGDLDVFIAFTGNTRDRLYQNDGDGTFQEIANTPVTASATSSSFGGWGDYDNDGDLDLYVARFASNPAVPALYRNDGAGEFTRTAQGEVGAILDAVPSPQAGNWGDYDSDGDLDLFILTYAIPPQRNGTPQPNYLIQNEQGNNNHWLKVKCIGQLSNRSAYGARITAVATIGGETVRQTRELMGGASSFVFQGEQLAHFGLGDATAVDSLIVKWPSGHIQILTNVSADQLLHIPEEIPTGFLRPNFFADRMQAADTTSISVQFNDVSLVDPNSPVISWEWDFNNDGIIDATDENPQWTFMAEEDGRFSVNLTVSNGIQAASLLRENYIEVTGHLPQLEMETSQLDMGSIPGNLSEFDTTFYMTNVGGGADSVSIFISDYFTADSSAISVHPSTARIEGQDSLAITFTLHPNVMAPRFYLPQIRIIASRNPDKQIFERRMRFTISVATGLGDELSGQPLRFKLHQNYPNPFNPETTIRYDIAKSGPVTLKIYNALGEEIRTLIHAAISAGSRSISWDGRSNRGIPVKSGVYFYTLRAGQFKETRKLLLIR